MPVLAFIILVSLIFYVLYKVRYFRTRLPMERKWLSAKSSIALGVFVTTFGVNRLFLENNTVTYFISAVFIIVGAISLYSGIRAYRFFLPLAIDEAEKARGNA